MLFPAIDDPFSCDNQAFSRFLRDETLPLRSERIVNYALARCYQNTMKEGIVV
jgi:hypothetical protein